MVRISRTPRRATVCVVALALGAALVGCGSDDDATTADDTATGAAPAATATTADGGAKDGAKAEPTETVDESEVPAWERTALPYRGQVGETVELECTAGGTAGAVWGTNVYTDDSSVCTAAVHVGLITLAGGGTVVFEVAEGEDEYQGSLHHDIESRDYGSWGGSFRFPDADVLEVEGIAWDRAAGTYTAEMGENVTVTCRPDGEPGSVWGTDVYTDDSSICTAAVHAGLIALAEGGKVTFRFAPGQEAYEGSEANGVTSSDYGSWDRSFEFVVRA